MAEDKAFCSYCDSPYTQPDYALHRVSNFHIKKVQRTLFHKGFASMCLVCDSHLKDLKDAESHVQEKKHMDLLKSLLVGSYVTNEKYTCSICGLSFFNEVALEAHYMRALHGRTYETPKLDELSRQLSGLCANRFSSLVNCVCSICNLSFCCLEDMIPHLFASAHIFGLRSSSCMICKKYFVHASDRELHLRSPKHHQTLQKCGNLLEEGRQQILQNKHGYPCMFCMIWCNSWFCLEIHILNEHHGNISTQSKTNYPFASRLTLTKGFHQGALCKESTISSWREWKGEATWERVWCHKCGTILSNIDDANRHLKDHSLEKYPTTAGLSSSKLLDSTLLPETFECCVCALSFKNAFMLTVHEGCFEHHSRLGASYPSNDLRLCENCGVLMHDKGGGVDAVACGDMKVSLPQPNDAKDSTQCPRMLQDKYPVNDILRREESTRVLDTIMESTLMLQANPQSTTFVVSCENVINGNKFSSNLVRSHKVSVADGSDRAYSEVNFLSEGKDIGAEDESAFVCSNMERGGEGVDDVLIECEPHGLGPFVLGRKSSHLSGTVGAGIKRGKAYLIESNGLPSKLPLSNGVAKLPAGYGPGYGQQHPDSALLGDQVLNGSGSKASNSAIKVWHAKPGVPVVVVATLAPLGTLQESLQSITTIITEALSSALPMFVQQSASPLKRKTHCNEEERPADDQPDVKKMCSEKLLEAALHQGLQSAFSNAAPMKNSCGLEACVLGSTSKEVDYDHTQGAKVVLAAAASIIPGSPPAFSSDAGVQGPAMVPAMQSDYGSCKQSQEFIDMKSERLSQVMVRDQASLEDGQIRLQASDVQLSSTTGLQKLMTTVCVSPRANGASDIRNLVQEELSLKAKEPAPSGESENLAQVMVRDQASVGQTPGVEDGQIQLRASDVQPSSILVRTGLQKLTTMVRVSPHANVAGDIRNLVQDELLFKAKEPAPSGESESNDADEDDYYIFKQIKARGKWWSCSDSEDSVTVD